jgi:hypothetical protein
MQVWQRLYGPERTGVVLEGARMEQGAGIVPERGAQMAQRAGSVPERGSWAGQNAGIVLTWPEHH